MNYQITIKNKKKTKTSIKKKKRIVDSGRNQRP